jgi:hypothetical protein
MHTPPILLPDVSDFAALFDYGCEWDHAWRRDHLTNATIAPVSPRYIGADPANPGRKLISAVFGPGDPGERNEIGPFLSYKPNALPGERRSMAVRATDLVLAALAPRLVTTDDHLGFEIIGHADGRALVICSHGHIIGSHWLARIDPATLPEPRLVPPDWVDYARQYGAAEAAERALVG